LKRAGWIRPLLSSLAALAVLAILGVAGWCGYRELAAQPIARVAFSGDVQKFAPQALDHLAQSVLGLTSLDEARARAKRTPWVREVALRREYPDGVEIELDAYDVLARWGDDALVSSRGEVFRAPFEGTLPRLRAPDAMAPAVVRDFALVQAALQPIASPIAEAVVSPRGAWRVTLASGLVIEVGRADIATRLERFAAAWPQLAAHGVATAHADLRHANGFALRRVADVTPSTPAPRKARPARKT
jgi:cell division protein FtsQ